VKYYVAYDKYGIIYQLLLLPAIPCPSLSSGYFITVTSYTDDNLDYMELLCSEDTKIENGMQHYITECTSSGIWVPQIEACYGKSEINFDQTISSYLKLSYNHIMLFSIHLIELLYPMLNSFTALYLFIEWSLYLNIN